MYQRARIGSERPTLLFGLATKRLVDKKVALPGMTVLERLVSGSRERAERRLWATLPAAPTGEQPAGLQRLVVVPTGKRLSELDRLRRSPRDITARGVGKALERYEALKTFGGAAWDLSSIPPERLQALVRFARAARAQAVSDLGGDRRLATLVAFAAVMPQIAADEAIEVFDLVMGDLIRSSSTRMTKQRLRTLKDLDAAAILLDELTYRLARQWLAERHQRRPTTSPYLLVTAHTATGDTQPLVSLQAISSQLIWTERMELPNHMRSMVAAAAVVVGSVAAPRVMRRGTKWSAVGWEISAPPTPGGYGHWAQHP